MERERGSNALFFLHSVPPYNLSLGIHKSKSMAQVVPQDQNGEIDGDCHFPLDLIYRIPVENGFV